MELRTREIVAVGLGAMTIVSLYVVGRVLVGNEWLAAGVIAICISAILAALFPAICYRFIRTNDFKRRP